MTEACFRLPELLREVDTNLDSCRKEFAQLPARFIGDPVGEIWRHLADFTRDVNYLVTGRPDDGNTGLIQRTRQSRQRFRESIFRGAPRFKPFARSDFKAESSQILHDISDGLEPVIHASGTAVFIDEVIRRAETSVPRSGIVPRILIDAYWHRSITRELPFNYPYAVKVHYIKRFTATWSKPAEELFREMESYFQRDLSSLVRKHFAAYAHGGLEGKIKYDKFHYCVPLFHSE